MLSKAMNHMSQQFAKLTRVKSIYIYIYKNISSYLISWCWCWEIRGSWGRLCYIQSNESCESTICKGKKCMTTDKKHIFLPHWLEQEKVEVLVEPWVQVWLERSWA